MADSIRIFPDYYCAPSISSRECWIARLTWVVLSIAAIELGVLAYSLLTDAMDRSPEPGTVLHTAPYIPPKPAFHSQESGS